MVIDLILDRKEGFSDLNAEYLEDMKRYEFDYINAAIDTNDDDTIKAALSRYIEENEYNPEIKNYINSVNWSVKQVKRNITITEAEAEKLENMVSYYLERFSLDDMIRKHPGFVEEDFEKVLTILKKALEV